MNDLIFALTPNQLEAAIAEVEEQVLELVEDGMEETRLCQNALTDLEHMRNQLHYYTTTCA